MVEEVEEEEEEQVEEMEHPPGQGDVHVVVSNVGGKVAGLEYLEMLVVCQGDVAGVSLSEGARSSPPRVPLRTPVLVVADQPSPAVVLRLKQ